MRNLFQVKVFAYVFIMIVVIFENLSINQSSFISDRKRP